MVPFAELRGVVRRLRALHRMVSAPEPAAT
jgi:hypothetical protein